MTQPQDEAVQILSNVLGDLVAENRDLVSIMRRCYLVCQMLNWTDWRDFFWQEMNGYGSAEAAPSWRSVEGQEFWRPKVGMDAALRIVISEMHWTDPDIGRKEVVSLSVFADIAWVVQAAQNGYEESTGTTKKKWVPSLKTEVTYERVRQYAAPNFARLLRTIENSVYSFASDRYALLRYGNAVSDFWQEYRQAVEAKVAGLGFREHLDAIQAGLHGDNPETWRNAVFGCRNLLADFASYLWRDSRATYEHLSSSSGGPPDLGAEKFANRLAAYVHQKGLSGTRGRFMRDEIERLATSIRGLIALEAEAHAPIGRDEARTVALSTYFILGELALRTDLIPIDEYSRPATT